MTLSKCQVTSFVSRVSLSEIVFSFFGISKQSIEVLILGSPTGYKLSRAKGKS
jgi:hypothetical protein